MIFPLKVEVDKSQLGRALKLIWAMLGRLGSLSDHRQLSQIHHMAISHSTATKTAQQHISFSGELVKEAERWQCVAGASPICRKLLEGSWTVSLCVQSTGLTALLQLDWPLLLGQCFPGYSCRADHRTPVLGSKPFPQTQ